jgi:hypothetical protein
MWSIFLYGAETWTRRKADHEYLENFEMQCWRRLENLIWTDRVKKKVSEEERNILQN